MKQNLLKYGLVMVLAMIASTALLWADEYVNVDSIIISQDSPKTTTSIQLSIGDTINTISAIEGNLNLCTCDSVNIVLSGAPSVKIVENKKIDWGVWMSLLAIIVNAIVVYFTFRNKKELQKHETGEIRTRKIQEFAISKQVEMYEKLEALMTDARALNKKSDADSAEILVSISSNTDFKKNVADAKDFLAKNSLYIRGTLKETATKILDIFGSTDFKYDLVIKPTLDNLFDQYSDIYNNTETHD